MVPGEMTASRMHASLRNGTIRAAVTPPPLPSERQDGDFAVSNLRRRRRLP
jgi:hypothetical protein